MLSFYKKYWRTAFDIALIVLTVYLIMYVFSFAWRIATPIFLALVIFAVIEPFAKYLHRKGVKKSTASALSVMIFTLLLLAVLTGIGVIFTKQILVMKDKLPLYADILQAQIAERSIQLEQQYKDLDSTYTDKIREYAAVITEKGAQLAQSFLNGLFRFITSFSTFMVNLFVGIILAYFLSMEIKDWRRIADEKTPRTFKSAYTFLKDNVLIGIGGYLKAQLKLITITFLIIFISLFLLGVNNALSIALLSALFDVLPLLGVPVIFVPWILYLVIVGNTTLAIWLTVLLVVVMLFRQLLEPKIMGDTLGVSAFTTLSFAIISLSLFGVAGMILSPVLIILLKALWDQGYLKRWIRMPKDEFGSSGTSLEELKRH
ncbi:permease [Paenibacillus swuensis]|uniref:Permease n=1 Tax=Paenibacillus swuensis TaxID=1178515 RepID=A0A172TJJ3_9BACL|nr:sporulation integral membrane protein YtvI [Paenibacillus swuensis]ANE47221.1 permease [Paenibacillus swuensis]